MSCFGFFTFCPFWFWGNLQRRRVCLQRTGVRRRYFSLRVRMFLRLHFCCFLFRILEGVSWCPRLDYLASPRLAIGFPVSMVGLASFRGVCLPSPAAVPDSWDTASWPPLCPQLKTLFVIEGTGDLRFETSAHVVDVFLQDWTGGTSWQQWGLNRLADTWPRARISARRGSFWSFQGDSTGKLNETVQSVVIFSKFDCCFFCFFANTCELNKFG